MTTPVVLLMCMNLYNVCPNRTCFDHMVTCLNKQAMVKVSVNEYTKHICLLFTLVAVAALAVSHCSLLVAN